MKLVLTKLSLVSHPMELTLGKTTLCSRQSARHFPSHQHSESCRRVPARAWARGGSWWATLADRPPCVSSIWATRLAAWWARSSTALSMRALSRILSRCHHLARRVECTAEAVELATGVVHSCSLRGIDNRALTACESRSKWELELLIESYKWNLWNSKQRCLWYSA